MTKDEALRMVLKNLKIIEAQDQGCGGNVTEAEAWRSAKRIAWHTINFCEEALETKDDAIALQYPQKDIDWQREQQIKAQGSATPQRTWVGLTDEDMNNALDYWSDDSRSSYGGAHAANGEYVDMIETWRYIEAKLKERNT